LSFKQLQFDSEIYGQNNSLRMKYKQHQLPTSIKNIAEIVVNSRFVARFNFIAT